MFARRDPSVAKEEEHRLAAAWRRWIQAAEALDSADEAEEFQAVGMRCRECLLKFIHMVASDTMVPEGERPPERSNFVRWSELIAETIAPSGSAERLRAYLKSISKSTWELVNWLTHAANAIRLDGQIAVDATQNILAAFGAALVRYERGVPDRYPSCSSGGRRTDAPPLMWRSTSAASSPGPNWY